MKKVILGCALIAFSIGAIAQTDTTRKTNRNTEKLPKNQTDPVNSNNRATDPNTQPPNTNQQGGMRKNGTAGQQPKKDSMRTGQGGENNVGQQCAITLENGKVLVLKDGMKTTMTNDSTLMDGSMVMSNGFVKMKDGTTMQLKEGDCMDMNGRLMPTNSPGSKSGTSGQKHK